MAKLRGNVVLAASLAMALFAVAPATCFLVEKEMYMSLYVTQTYSGKDTNQAVVLKPEQPGGFGNTAVHDWTVANGQDQDATVVGRAQGLHFKSSATNSTWYIILTIVFEGTRFKGSTLQMMGFVPENGQWSIIGGTGELTMARGVVRHKVVKNANGSRTYALDIHLFYTPLDDLKASRSSGSNPKNFDFPRLTTV